ncbi:hypothetical protein QTP86_006611 [Hemibagrus guttatus]|nr:hypothetical protein QTP86_006611 [Hemibagrus guttatus]
MITFYKKARATFIKLKTRFTTAPVLRHPDPNLPFIVEVDASSCGIGAVLLQRHGNAGKVYPCAYFLRKLTPAEANYDVGNRELLSIKEALERWHHWLKGAHHPFLALTDHCNLEYLRNAKRCTMGPDLHQLQLLQLLICRTTTLISNRFWWPTLAQDVQEYVGSCDIWAYWSHMAVDYSLPSSEGYNTILLVIDRFSKACRLVPLKGLPTAMETAMTLFHRMFHTYSLPEDIVSDQVPQFIL